MNKETTRKTEVFRKKTKETRKQIESLEKIGLVKCYGSTYECKTCHQVMFNYHNLFYDAVNDWRSEHKSFCPQHKIYEGIRALIRRMPTEYITQKNIEFESHYKNNKKCKVKVVGWGQEKHDENNCRQNYLECDALTIYINNHSLGDYFCCLERVEQEVNSLYECTFCHEPWIRGAKRGFYRDSNVRTGIHPNCMKKQSEITGWNKVEFECKQSNCEETTFFVKNDKYICYGCKNPIDPIYPPNFKGNKNGSDGFVDLIIKGLRPTMWE